MATEKEKEKQTVRRKLSALVLDEAVYPRVECDGPHVSVMVAAEAAGVVFPHYEIDAATNTVIDGWHRYQKDRRLYGEDHEVTCNARFYRNRGEMLLAAIGYNASHGKPLSTFDRARAALKALAFRCTMKAIAAACGMTPETLKALAEGRTARVRPSVASPTGHETTIKRTIQHMKGCELTPDQADVNRKLCGHEQPFLLNQIVLLLENELLDWEDGRTVKLLRRIIELAESRLASAVVA